MPPLPIKSGSLRTILSHLIFGLCRKRAVNCAVNCGTTMLASFQATLFNKICLQSNDSRPQSDGSGNGTAAPLIPTSIHMVTCFGVRPAVLTCGAGRARVPTNMRNRSRNSTTVGFFTRASSSYFCVSTDGSKRSGLLRRRVIHLRNTAATTP